MQGWILTWGFSHVLGKCFNWIISPDSERFLLFLFVFSLIQFHPTPVPLLPPQSPFSQAHSPSVSLQERVDFLGIPTKDGTRNYNKT